MWEVDMAGMLPRRRSREELEAANRILIEQHERQLSLWLAATFQTDPDANHARADECDQPEEKRL
jgi:hypothetical protein